MLQNISEELDSALRRKAVKDGRPVDEVAVDALKTAFGLSNPDTKRRELSDLAGTWLEDSQFDAIMLEQDKVDTEAWR